MAYRPDDPSRPVTVTVTRPEMSQTTQKLESWHDDDLVMPRPELDIDLTPENLRLGTRTAVEARQVLLRMQLQLPVISRRQWVGL